MNFKASFLLSAFFGLLALAGPALTAEEGALVILTPAEGKMTVNGELVRADAKKVVLRLMGDQPQEESFPWEKIKHLSNGLTKEKAIAAIQADPEKRCPVCGGKAVVTCQKCGGSGRLTDVPKVKCSTCNGEGLVKCPDCVDGQAPCPSHCLTLREGKWEKWEGKIWRKFYYTDNGTQHCASWSSGHAGQVIAYENGKPVNKGTCPTCGGKTTIDCPHCKGTGKVTCPECQGEKVSFPVCPDCQKGLVDCPACKGTGLKWGIPGTPYLFK
jgi:hypothetical protein